MTTSIEIYRVPVTEILAWKATGTLREELLERAWASFLTAHGARGYHVETHARSVEIVLEEGALVVTAHVPALTIRL